MGSAFSCIQQIIPYLCLTSCLFLRFGLSMVPLRGFCYHPLAHSIMQELHDLDLSTSISNSHQWECDWVCLTIRQENEHTTTMGSKVSFPLFGLYLVLSVPLLSSLYCSAALPGDGHALVSSHKSTHFFLSVFLDSTCSWSSTRAYPILSLSQLTFPAASDWVILPTMTRRPPLSQGQLVGYFFLSCHSLWTIY